MMRLLFAEARVVLMAACVLLTACAGSPPLTDSSGQAIAVPVASFKLQQAVITWQPHADYQVRGTVRARDQKALDTFVPKVAADMEKMYVLLKTDAPRDLAAALARSGVTAGPAQTIELRPLYGYFEQRGSGSGIVLQVSVVNVADGKTWVHRVKADTGMHVINPLVGPSPDSAYTKGFVDGLLRIFREAGLVP